jgi:flagellar biosynthesis/type III secretory pathway M-ring protein FliF/YscJ
MSLSFEMQEKFFFIPLIVGLTLLFELVFPELKKCLKKKKEEGGGGRKKKEEEEEKKEEKEEEEKWGRKEEVERGRRKRKLFQALPLRDSLIFTLGIRN